ADRLDELSITDDDFVSRLNAAENDLIDAYVRGELPAESRERFRSFYMASPKRREKVRFAETLLAYQKKMASAVPETARPGRADQPEREKYRRQPRRSFFQLIPQWGFAAAALLLLVAAALLLIQNRRLNRQMMQSEAERARLEQNQQVLEQHL